MQDRYAGDVGDFGKLGMLRCMEASGLKVGINWYLVGDESHNNDGKYIGYMEDEKYRGCDDELLASLTDIQNYTDARLVEALQSFSSSVTFLLFFFFTRS